MGNAGRVLMIPKGDYNAATTYERLDFVYYQGRSYVCKQTSTGNAPTNTTYWQALTGDASAEIQALTNQLGNEVTTRAALGAHNLAPLRSLSELKTALNTGTWNDDVYSIAGVDVSFLMDGNTVVGAKLNGTSTGEASIYIGDTLSLPAGEYIFSTPNKFSGDKSLYLSISNIDISMNININTKTNFTLQSNVSGGRVYIYFGSGRIFNNFEIKPMIRLATDSDSTYQPYAKTNVELTTDKADKSDLASISITGTTNNTGAAISEGTYFYLNGALVKAKTNISNGATLTSGTNYVAVTAGALNELGEFSRSSNNSIVIERIGHMVHLYTSGVVATSNVVGQTIVTDSALRTKTKIMSSCILRDASLSTYSAHACTVETNGTLVFLTDGGSNITDTTSFDYCTFDIMYFIY